MASHSSTFNYFLYSIFQYNQLCFWKKYKRGIGYFYSILCNFINSSYDEICANSSCPRCVKFLNFTGLSYEKWLNIQLGTSSKIVTTSCLAHFWQRGSQPAETLSKRLLINSKPWTSRTVFKTCQAMTRRRGPSVSVINSIGGADECQHPAMVLMESWGPRSTLASDTLWQPLPGLRDQVSKNSNSN